MRQVTCDSCGKVAPVADIFTLTTSQVIVSKDFWNKFMTNEQMLLVSELHFVQKNVEATKARAQVVTELLRQNDPWAICAECTPMFKINLESAKIYTSKILSNPTFIPPNNGDATLILNRDELEEIYIYAATYAGQEAF